MSNIKGIGTDIIEIERIRHSIERHGKNFLDRLFTKREQEYCKKYNDPIPHFAGRFAAKEAIVKALGVGFGEHAHWHDIEVLPNAEGKPLVSVSEPLRKTFNDPDILLSISHAESYASAFALWQVK